MLTLLHWFFNIPRFYKRIVTLCFDTLFISSSFFLAIYIRVGNEGWRWVDKDVRFVILALIPLTLAFWIHLGLYRAVIRYIDIKILTNILWGSIGSTLLLMTLAFVFSVELLRSIPFIYFTLILILVAGSRLLIRGFINAQSTAARAPVVIYGAGSAGRQLCLSLQNGSEYDPVVFVDDNTQLHGSIVANVKVVSPEKLGEVVKLHNVTKILLAISNSTNERRRTILNKLGNLGVEMMTIPGSADLVSGKISVTQLRNLDINDLLGRDPVPPNKMLLGKCIASKSVLVTGAGGSIGSELCRQILLQKPSKIVLYEISEIALYSIEKELVQLSLSAGTSSEIVPVLASVLDKKLFKNIVINFDIETIYHAAAYKHVPLVEYNVASGLRNNVLGTLYCAEVASECHVKDFVLISTDKAVRPTNVMGTSKRIAELILQGLYDRDKSKRVRTRFSMVRFGNVLGSSGSVVPLFQKQIAQGGPVTITHKDIIRYFMTIPEAAQLVIQAGAMCEGGEVYVLDMGEAIEINSLAVKMIHLAGLTVKSEQNPDGDIEIVYSGLRPGEKLYEELLIGGDVEGTLHKRIMKARESLLDWDSLSSLLNNLFSAIENNDIPRVFSILEDAPLGFKPSSTISDCLMIAQQSHGVCETTTHDPIRIVSK